MLLVIRIRLSSCFKRCWPFYKYFWTINYATGLWVMFLKCNWECFVNCFLVRPPNTLSSRAYITSNHLWKVLDTVEGETPNLYAKSSVWMFSLSFISTSSNSSIRLSLVGLCTNGCRKLKRTVKMWAKESCRSWYRIKVIIEPSSRDTPNLRAILATLLFTMQYHLIVTTEHSCYRW